MPIILRKSDHCLVCLCSSYHYDELEIDNHPQFYHDLPNNLEGGVAFPVSHGQLYLVKDCASYKLDLASKVPFFMCTQAIQSVRDVRLIELNALREEYVLMYGVSLTFVYFPG